MPARRERRRAATRREIAERAGGCVEHGDPSWPILAPARSPRGKTRFFKYPQRARMRGLPAALLAAVAAPAAGLRHRAARSHDVVARGVPGADRGTDPSSPPRALPASHASTRCSRCAVILCVARALHLCRGAARLLGATRSGSAQPLRPASATSAQGFVPAILARELLLRTSPLRAPLALLFLVTATCLAISAFLRVQSGGRAARGASPTRSSARRATSGIRSGTCSSRCSARCRADRARPRARSRRAGLS
jgi:hypothetical protein